MHILLKWVLLWSYGWLLYALIIRELTVASYWTCNAIQGTLFIWFAVSFIVNVLESLCIPFSLITTPKQPNADSDPMQPNPESPPRK